MIFGMHRVNKNAYKTLGGEVEETTPPPPPPPTGLLRHSTNIMDI
jgi:hypothetical protein